MPDAAHLSRLLHTRPRILHGQRATSGCALIALGACAATAERR